jgi:hypothetical protein
MKKNILMLSLLILALGCATVKPAQKTMLPGKIYSLKDGTALSFTIEMAVNSGDMTAYNPLTNENFTGRYTGIFTGGGVSQSTATNNWGNTSGKVTTVSGPTGAKVKGILRGDKGTVIDLNMDVQPGTVRNPPTGIGEGIDNNGLHYQVQF